MRYTRIDIQGTTGRYATMSRKRDSDQIEIAILAPEHEVTFTASATDHEDRWVAAMTMQDQLDLERGNASAIQEYDDALRSLAGQR